MAEMPSETTPVRHGHETRDVDIRFIGLFSLGMMALLVGSLALMGWLFSGTWSVGPYSRDATVPAGTAFAGLAYAGHAGDEAHRKRQATELWLD